MFACFVWTDRVERLRIEATRHKEGVRVKASSVANVWHGTHERPHAMDGELVEWDNTYN